MTGPGFGGRARHEVPSRGGHGRRWVWQCVGMGMGGVGKRTGFVLEGMGMGGGGYGDGWVCEWLIII